MAGAALLSPGVTGAAGAVSSGVAGAVGVVWSGVAGAAEPCSGIQGVNDLKDAGAESVGHVGPDNVGEF